MTAKDEALKILLSKKRTAKQITDKLIEKGYSAEEAEEATEYFKEKGYIDEGDYARRYVHDAVLIKGHGRARIVRDLKMRGVSDADIEEALENAEYNLAEKMAKKFPECAGIKEKNRIFNHFLRKGFSAGEIAEAFNEIYKQEF